jgi:hypothetical protein
MLLTNSGDSCRRLKNTNGLLMVTPVCRPYEPRQEALLLQWLHSEDMPRAKRANAQRIATIIPRDAAGDPQENTKSLSEQT